MTVIRGPLDAIRKLRRQLEEGRKQNEFKLRQAKCLLRNIAITEPQLDAEHAKHAPFSDRWWGTLRKLNRIVGDRIEAEREVRRQEQMKNDGEGT